MAKLSAGMAGKLKNLARGLKEDNNGTVKKSSETKQTEAHKKQSIGDSKASGLKGNA